MDKELTRVVKKFREALPAKGIFCAQEKEINYGCQLICCKGAMRSTVNWYYGRKGISVVLQGKDTPLKEELRQLTKVLADGKKAAAAAPEELIRPYDVKTWIGCDESGKGDVFGPLAAAACLLTEEDALYFQEIGVCDSKTLPDSTIIRLAEQIKGRLGDRCTLRAYPPEDYNRRYAALKKEGKNLNHLLGCLHAENICVLLSKYECPCIIVDKFGKDSYVLDALGCQCAGRQVIQVPRGERDIAVAAASVLARSAFIEGIPALERAFSLSFPKGAWAGIDEAIRLFLQTHEADDLQYVGKLNFKTFDFLR